MEQKLANPGPIGLTGFGLTTILLNLHNAGLFQLDVMILAMGVFVGGIAQMIAGRLEFQKGNTFATLAFTLYGAFWLSLVFIFIFPQGLGSAGPVSSVSMGAYLFMWGVFTFFMTIGAFKAHNALKIVFVTLTILFFLLAIANFTGSQLIHTIAGYEGIICGLTALYVAVAEVINEVYEKTVLPI